MLPGLSWIRSEFGGPEYGDAVLLLFHGEQPSVKPVWKKVFHKVYTYNAPKNQCFSPDG
jgi:hypothetical protein